MPAEQSGQRTPPPRLRRRCCRSTRPACVAILRARLTFQALHLGTRMRILVVQPESRAALPNPLPPSTGDVVQDALDWLMPISDGLSIPNVFSVFPELTPDAITARILSLWGALGDRGAFRDAVESIFHNMTDECRAQALPRVYDILASSEYSVGARALAFRVLEDWCFDKPELPADEMQAINVDFLGDCGFSECGSVENASQYMASLMHSDGRNEPSYEFVERIRQRVGMPYAYALYAASLDATPWHEEVLRRLATTGCHTTRYLLEIAHLDAQARTQCPIEKLNPEIVEMIEQTIDACRIGPGPGVVRDEWFRSAKFWLSACDLHHRYLLATWVPTPRPGGNFVYLLMHPDDVPYGRCQRSYPEHLVPDEIFGLPLTPIDASLALTYVQRGFEVLATRQPAASVDPRSGPNAAFDALLHLEHAAVQMMCADGETPPTRPAVGELEVLHPERAASPAKLAALLASDPYKAWGAPRDLPIMIQAALGAQDWRSDLQRQFLSEFGRSELAAACRHMAEWHRSRSQHTEAALISAAARDMTPPGSGRVLLEALTDLWVNILVPTREHPFAGTAGEGLQALVDLELDAQASAVQHPQCAGRSADFARAFATTLAMLETVLKNFPNATPGDHLGDVAALLTEIDDPAVTKKRARELNLRCSDLLRAHGLDAGQTTVVLRDIRTAWLQRRRPPAGNQD